MRRGREGEQLKRGRKTKRKGDENNSKIKKEKKERIKEKDAERKKEKGGGWEM